MQANLEFFKITKDSKKEDFAPENNGACVSEIANSLIDMNEEATIVKLTLLDLKNMSVGMFRDLLRVLHSIDDKYVLYGVVYLTTNEFPESEYYDDTFITEPNKDIIDKKPIDYTLSLPKAALFDKFGFKEVYRSYYSSNFIFPNNIGNKILDYWDLDN